jgi:hypothetical protein
MASKVDICNLALSHIAQAVNITSIEPPDGSAFAEHCAQHYPTARDMCLEMHEWTFATTRQVLSAVDLPAEVSQWRYAYDYPTGVIRPLAILLPQCTDDTQGQPYRIEVDALTDDRIILTNVQDATMKYIRRNDDPVQYTPLFVIALSWLLAHFIAGPITKKASIVDACEKQWEKWMKRATGANAQSTDESAYKRHVPEHIRQRDTIGSLVNSGSPWSPFPANQP